MFAIRDVFVTGQGMGRRNNKKALSIFDANYFASL